MTDKRDLREIIDLNFNHRVLSEDLMVESSQRHCDMYMASDGKWYMELAGREYGDREEADTYGPFPDQEACMDYLDNFSNPGGWGEDDSGTRKPPTQNPNGNKVQNPRSSGGGGSFSAFGGRFGGSRY